MKIYAVTISGQKHYFYSELSSTIIHLIDRYCSQVSDDCSTKDAKERLVSFFDFIRNNLGLEITPVEIEHIFRINL